MWVCSAINKESKPRSSIALARAPGAIPSSVTNVEIPNFMPSLNHTERVSEVSYSPSTGDSLADRRSCGPLLPIRLWAFHRLCTIERPFFRDDGCGALEVLYLRFYAPHRHNSCSRQTVRRNAAFVLT